LKNILIHTCCGPCASASVERLIADGYGVTLYYSNSNIFPESEYRKRLEQVKKLADKLDLSLELDEYNHSAWQERVKGLEKEPERGRRCEKCFKFSLGRTAEAADKLNIPYFTTTLTISPHKSSKTLFEIGKKYSKFLARDFKKKDGFKRSLELSCQHGLYRQDYCGCEFSRPAKA
jgi:predicted adenine nucleotide alpha hydrolase (AANH) superfamily ATPase